jgi:hypothetical protein
MEERTKLNDIAPKDVKKLEVLKPIKTPSMGERYKQAIEKEKRLEAASRPVQKATKSQETTSDPEEKKNKKAAKKNLKKKKQMAALDSTMITEDALEQEDKIEEGINWSDDDE